MWCARLPEEGPAQHYHGRVFEQGEGSDPPSLTKSATAVPEICKKEKWVSWNKNLPDFNQDEAKLQVNWGRIAARESSIPRFWEYMDTHHITVTMDFIKNRQWDDSTNNETGLDQETSVFDDSFNGGLGSGLVWGATGMPSDIGVPMGLSQGKCKGVGRQFAMCDASQQAPRAKQAKAKAQGAPNGPTRPGPRSEAEQLQKAAQKLWNFGPCCKQCI